MKISSPAIVAALFVLTVLLLAEPAHGASADVSPRPVREWGNARYVDLAIGEKHRYMGRTLTLLSTAGDSATIEVDGVRETLTVARRTLPTIVSGVRVFLSSNRTLASLTPSKTFPDVYGASRRDALLCLSDPGKPLLDPSRFTFPISRDDGYVWKMEEDSHMFAYISSTRAHEGIDLDLHEARGLEKHAIVAVEDGLVHWVETALTGKQEACVLIESTAQPNLYYIYQHLNRDKLLVTAGQKVARGDKLGYIWGDFRWGHLHFAVVGHSDAPPSYSNRYRNLLNAFPQLYELSHGNLDPIPRRWERGQFEFTRQYWLNGNRRRLSAFDDIVGYGWLLGSWCAAGKVETSHNGRTTSPDQSAILRKRMHAGTAHPAENPNDYFDFEVAVQNGAYRIMAEVGDVYSDTWQAIEFEGMKAGTYTLRAGPPRWTPEQIVTVNDGRLTIRIHLKDELTPAGLRNLNFARVE